jgi:hypothetical protein
MSNLNKVVVLFQLGGVFKKSWIDMKKWHYIKGNIGIYSHIHMLIMVLYCFSALEKGTLYREREASLEGEQTR